MWLTPLMHTDVYKLGHQAQYRKTISKIYAGLVARSNRVYNASVQFGDTFFMKEYLLEKIERSHVKGFLLLADAILGPGKVGAADFYKLQELGYWPVEIKSLPEGSLVPTGNILTTYESTNPDLPWVGGFLEGLLIKVWNSNTVATNSFRLRKVVELFAEKTCDSAEHVDYQIHDFGYRGCSSEETAAIGGSAHLLSFRGTDTIPGVALLDAFYNNDNSTPLNAIGSSVPASEHSVACAWSATQGDLVDTVEEVFNEDTGNWEIVGYLKNGQTL